MPYYGILTAANPKEDLKFLNLEFQKLNEYFNPLANIVNTTINLNAIEPAVFETFLSKADIRIFHFSGHAGGCQILMDDGRLSHGNILAAMIRYAKHLKLVFLNGCATYDLVDKFLEYGASLVIATNARVFDSVACDFSTFFYEGLCVRRLSIGQAFDAARNKISESIKNKLQEPITPKQPNETENDYNKRIADNADYQKVLNDFNISDTARTISKAEGSQPGTFQWGIYHNENSSNEQREENERWHLIDEVEISPIDHIEPSFDFLASLGQSVVDLKKTLSEKDPHWAVFSEIETQYKRAITWNAAGTGNLINNLFTILLSPLVDPFREVINYSKDNRTQLTYPGNISIAILTNLLKYQVELYKKFVRTAVEIMLSDFMETIILIGQSRSENLNMQFNQSLHNNNLSELVKPLLDGHTNLSDIEFDIGLMRSIVTFLAEGRSKASQENRLAFRQFVGEYNGNIYVSGIDMALNNSNHEVAIAIMSKFEKGDLEQTPVEGLRCYCDRMESALISLFAIHKYLNLYEIITVGKVEAYRRRDRRYRSICHDIFTVTGVLPPDETTTYGENFAENYSVLIVTNRKKFLDYLSLSPFIIDVGLFFEQDTLLYFFNGLKGDYMEYIAANGNGTIHINLNIASNDACITDIKDITFLRISPEIGGASNRDLRIQARQRFAGVRDQFKKITYLYLLLTRNKTKKASAVNQL